LERGNERESFRSARGSRNKGTLFLEELLDGEGEALTRKATELAKKGDPVALRLCLERLLPPRRERAIHLILPKVTEAQHASAAFASILEAVGEGKITPGEGEILSGIAEARLRYIGVESLELRISELEKRSKRIGGAHNNEDDGFDEVGEAYSKPGSRPLRWRRDQLGRIPLPLQSRAE
jgi:hypothetical protein